MVRDLVLEDTSEILQKKVIIIAGIGVCNTLHYMYISL